MSDPPGGTLYKQNGELWGPCPKVLWYDLDEEALATGQLKAKGLVVRWPSGPEKKSDETITFPMDRTDQQFTFVQSEEQAEAVKAVSKQDVELRDEPDEQSALTREMAKAPQSVNAPTEEQANAVTAQSEKDAGLREEPEEPSVTAAETANVTGPADDVSPEQADAGQVESQKDPGLLEEPDVDEVQTANTAGSPSPNNGIIEKRAGTGSEPDPGKGTEDGQTSVPEPRPRLSPKASEDPNEKSIQVKTEIKNVDFANGVKMDFVEIPPGAFTRGSSLDENRDDSVKNPTQRVRISKSFWIGVYEVTQEQYEKVMGVNPSSFGGPRRPVEKVSWNDAQIFCERLSSKENGRCRLPTEAEWEYACRAGTTTAYYWGDNFDSRYALTIADLTIADHQAGTDNVGTRLRNDWGLFDMSGNVWEWCEDWYKEYDPSLAEVIDPKGPQTGKFRVLRGGSWGHSQRNCRSAHRNWHTPNHRYDDCGFRVVLELEQPSIDAVETPLP